MSDYSVVTSGMKTLCVFDNYRDAREFQRKEQEDSQILLCLLCMHPCGCLYEARFTRNARGRGVHFAADYEDHTHWLRTKFCLRHGKDEAWGMYGHNDAAIEKFDECICWKASLNVDCPRHGRR